MLREIQNVRQVKGEPRRRWFTSNRMDLIVWCYQVGDPLSFQLCYDKGANERALTWRPDIGFSHMAVDDGDAAGGMRYKATPILIADGKFDASRVADLFAGDSRSLPPQLAEFVLERLEEYAGQATPSK